MQCPVLYPGHARGRARVLQQVSAQAPGQVDVKDRVPGLLHDPEHDQLCGSTRDKGLDQEQLPGQDKDQFGSMYLNMSAFMRKNKIDPDFGAGSDPETDHVPDRV